MPVIPSHRITDLDALPDHPVILIDHRPALACETLGDLLRAAAFPRLSGYRVGEADLAEIDAADAIADFAAGRLGLSIVDSYVTVDADPLDALTVPGLIDEGNLFMLYERSRPLRKSLVITQAGGYTAPHVDAWGMAGWMYLYRGRKKWQLWEPAVAALLYDTVTERYYDDAGGDRHRHDYCRAVLEALPRWEGEIGPGQLLWFPEAWAHRVWTPEDSFGFGGSSLHAGRLGQALQCWLRERRLGFSDSFDFRELLRCAAAHGVETEGFVRAVEDTFALWERNRA